MSIIKLDHTIVDDDIINNEDLSYSARGLYTYLCSLRDYPDLEISKKSLLDKDKGCSMYDLNSILQELDDAGIINIEAIIDK